MGKLAPIAFVVFLSGCAALTTVAAIPGVMVEGIVDMFQGQERSLPVGMRTALVATQQGLRTTSLDVDVLEPVKEKYDIAFGNSRLDGILKLKPQTSTLTTLDIKVHHGVEREKSVELTLMDEIQHFSTRVSKWQRFSFKGYGDIYASPSVKAKRIGWYRLRAKVNVTTSHHPGWLRIEMPSGTNGFVKGEL